MGITFEANRFMQQGENIKRLTVTTVIILLGIVALQFYWLLTSYQQQQQRFYADIDNALASTSAELTLHKALATQPEAIRKVFGFDDAADTSDAEVSDEIIAANRRKKVLHMVNSVIKVKDSAMLKSMKALFDSAGLAGVRQTGLMQVQFTFTDSDLVVYKDAYKKELSARHITLPVDLAVVDSTDSVCAATCDTAAFRHYPLKSSFIELPGTNGQYGLTAGFSNPNYFVLRNMFWVLAITVTLIILGSWSLGYLLVTFFRQGKIAEIRNDFMNNMTHELKTPISSISLALEMSLDERFSLGEEKKKSYLLSAQKEVVRLKLIVENVLKILSLEKAELDIVRSEIQVRPWLNAIIERIMPLLEKKQVMVRVNVEPNDLSIFADKIHLSNVIYNILENAIKYNDKPRPFIHIAFEARQDGVRCSIRDNGEGIPEKYLDKIFEKFFRVPKGNQHDVKGYGLGLSYVKSVIDLHGGSIAARSFQGKETEFIIHLPLN